MSNWRGVCGLLAVLVGVSQALPLKSGYTADDGLWSPDTGSREEWLRCHGFPCEEWEKTRDLLTDMKLASLPGSFDHEHLNMTSLREDDSLDNCIWLTGDQIKEILAQKEKDLLTPGESLQRDAADQPHSRQKRKIEDFDNPSTAFRKWTFPIHWKFDGKHTTQEQDEIRGGFRSWEAQTCVRFQELGVRENFNNHHILVTAEGTGCHSFIGRITHWPQQLNLQSVCVLEFGVSVHEIGHALGMWHEQQRSDRDDHIDINWGNLGFYIGQFHKRSTPNLGVEYDVGSVMHYAPFDGAKDRRIPVMTTKDKLYQKNMGQRTGHSFNDAKIINRAYCGDICRTPLSGQCLRGGYQDPNDCSRCRCPDGFSGTYCQQVAPSVNVPEQCGGEINARTDPQRIRSPGYATVGHYLNHQQCSWLLRAPPGHTVRLEFEGDFGLYCYYQRQCHHWVEVRYKGNLDVQGPRFCCYSRPDAVLNSDGREMTIVFRSNWTAEYDTSRRGFQASIRAVPLDGITQPPSVSTTPRTTTTTPVSTTTTTPRTTTTLSPTPRGNNNGCSQVDLSFILDSSGSVMNSNWPKVLKWVKNTVRHFPPVGSRGTQVALASFGNKGTLHFRFDEHTDLESLFAFISSIRFKDERTNTADGIRVMRNGAYLAEGARPGARKVSLLMTDHEASIFREDTLPEALASRNIGIELHVVGVGKDFNEREARQLTGDSSRVYYVRDFDELESGQQTEAIYNKICSNADSTTRPSSGSTTPSSPPPQFMLWECDFEDSSLCGATQDTRDNFDWWRHSGQTPSDPTGPDSAASGEWYMYIEATDKTSEPRKSGDIARLIVHDLEAPGPACVLFDYSMFGHHVNSLELGLKRDGVIRPQWSKHKEQGKAWRHAMVDVNLTKHSQLTFTAARGDEYSGDIAIDNIRVYSGVCGR